jgi:pre-rRNA-processing protein TSR4
MVLLAQLYAPAEPEDVGHEGAFHRVLYVWSCASGACLSAPGRSPCVAAFRCQLPRHNAVLPPEGDALIEPPLVERCAALCAMCGCDAPQRCAQCKAARYCSREHQAVHWKAGHKAVCSAAAEGEGIAPARSGFVERERDKRAALEAGCVLPEWEIVIEDEPSPDERVKQAEESLPPNAALALREMRESSRVEDGAAVGDAAAGEATAEDFDMTDLTQSQLNDALKGSAAPTAVDPVLTRFHTRIAVAPSQVVRYCQWPLARGAVESEEAAEQEEEEEELNSLGAPLWFSTAHQPAAGDIPPCELCGAPRAFEFQLMPQALFYLLKAGSASLDFGTIAVFTCTKACCGPEPYAREHAWLQVVRE